MIHKTRETKETAVNLELKEGLEGSTINTGVGFLDHMLDLFAFHSQLVLNIQVKGDYHIDDHHTTEDLGIVLGQALNELFKSRTNFARYGTAYVPMDETLSRTVTDISGRPYLSFNAQFSKEKVGTFDVELVEEFFRAVVINARLTTHIDLIRGGNTHHEIESIFKSFAQSLRAALQQDVDRLPSTKGVIE